MLLKNLLVWAGWIIHHEVITLDAVGDLVTDLTIPT